jgi:hypothetical protein
LRIDERKAADVAQTSGWHEVCPSIRTMTFRWIPLLGVALVGCAMTAPTLGSGSSDDPTDNSLRQLAGDGEGTTCPADDAGTADGGTSTEARVIGRINEKYLALGGCASFLGKPLGNEQKTPDGIGRYSVFTHGSIYWTPSIGTAYEVHGDIRDAWAKAGWEAGALGYPTSDEYAVDGGRRNDFAHGNITWDAATRKTSVNVTDTQGQATYYYFNGGGACGLPTPGDHLIAAINDEQYSKANCGRCAYVTGPKGSVLLRIVDKCPGCGWGDLDLSQQAFERIASTSAGRVKIGWHFADCP